MPRTGTTFLHTLLSADPANRAPLTWEVMNLHRDERGEATAHPARSQILLSGMDGAEFSETPSDRCGIAQECVSLMSPSFLSDQFDTMYNVAGLSKMFLQQDLQPAYEFHRRFLQIAGTRKWSPLDSKSAYHMFGLPRCSRSYPDALFLQTHRRSIEAITLSPV